MLAFTYKFAAGAAVTAGTAVTAVTATDAVIPQ